MAAKSTGQYLISQHRYKAGVMSHHREDPGSLRLSGQSKATYPGDKVHPNSDPIAWSLTVSSISPCGKSWGINKGL
jgi:hypothetical protein